MRRNLQQLDPATFGRQPDGAYAPAPQEIKERCIEIRSTWSQRELEARSAWAAQQAVVQIPVAELGWAELE